MFMTFGKESEWGGLEICHMFTHSIFFKQRIFCSFLRMGVRGVVCGRHNRMIVGIKTCYDKKAFSFVGSVIVKQPSSLLNICTFTMKSNLKHF